MARQTQPQRLPRGRHGLTREQVLSSQRARMLAAIAAAVAEDGYVATSVASVIDRAGVSRETFYEHFANKEDCFMAAFDAGVDALLARIGAALEEPGPMLERLDRALAAYLDALAEEPELAYALLLGVYAAGPAALARRDLLQRRFVDAVGALLDTPTEAERFACEALVAAVSSMVTMRIGIGAFDELPGMREPIIALAGKLLHADSA